MMLTKGELIELLGLRPHIEEGGYYSEQYRSDQALIGNGAPAVDTIYYMLTDDSPIGYFHRNKSDIVHFYHVGVPLRYTTIASSGAIETFVLGTDGSAGQHLQRVVRGGYWKATELLSGEFGLISEAVVPSFSPRDRTVASRSLLRELFPLLDEQLLRLAWPDR